MLKISRELSGLGFQRQAGSRTAFAFEGYLPVKNLQVPICIKLEDCDFIQAPKIYLLDDRPKAFQKPLPHVSSDGELCYLEREEVYLDPSKPVKVIRSLLAKAADTLTHILNGNLDNDVPREFLAYWGAKMYGSLVSGVTSSHSYKLVTAVFYDRLNNQREEILVGGAADINRMLKVWGCETDINHHSCLCFKLNKEPVIPWEDRVSWSIETWPGFLSWLKTNDQSLYDRLLNALSMKENRKRTLGVIFSSEAGEWGFILTLLQEKLFHELKNLPPTHYRKRIQNSKRLLRFEKVSLRRAHQQHIVSRNLPSSASFMGKRIAIIGAGTIGSGLLRLLAQCGAGVGGGRLTIFDNGVLDASNLGRHYLDAGYLYCTKSSACAHKLSQEFPSIDVVAKQYNWSETEAFDKYHLIIDATGFEGFSEQLNRRWVQQNLSIKDTSLLHIWIEGHGESVRGLWNQKGGACYRCLRLPDGQPRFPLRNDTVQVRRSYACGESFQPYLPSAPNHAAALCLDMLYEWLQGDTRYTFKSMALKATTRVFPNKKLSQVKGCPVCGI
ncbi:E2/UBC family protein [uncultured Endozoicomonas sp.]|uniref:ThiF family adenylyltransferase n=1 Tax=uncultured Endozoicomonas sp. TaxID=432652 RepID=UPI00262D93A7|nr:E2/UBC family protein [uncultured Endozoicomonas sp.]